jgi:hypothetical protein
LGDFKTAVECEKKAYHILSSFLGRDHAWAKESDEELKTLTRLAVEKESRTLQTGGLVKAESLGEDKARAEAIAADLLAGEDATRSKRRSAAKKKKKSKK